MPVLGWHGTIKHCHTCMACKNFHTVCHMIIVLNVRLTADIWILQVQPVLLGFQKHLEIYSFRLRLMINESSRDASREVGFITAKAQVQENLLRIIIPQVEYVHHTANRRRTNRVLHGTQYVSLIYT